MTSQSRRTAYGRSYPMTTNKSLSKPWYASSSKQRDLTIARSRAMTDPSKITPSHTQRAAFVYVRQSTPSQVEHNRESTARQYGLVDRAHQLGWSDGQVVVIDQDLGLSGATT